MRFRFLIHILLVGLIGTGVAWSATDVSDPVATQREAPRFRALATGPVELGRVHWLRDFDLAVETAKSSHKPLLILFQEVPGCNVSTGYGREVLSHPLLVEAIESNFVPVAVYNNVGGADRRTLDKFGEPTWNNPVVRIVDADLAPLTPRLAGDYSIGGLAKTMVEAIALREGKVPPYLRLLHQEAQGRQADLSLAVFGMPCFWTGEAALGAIEGVIDTAPGFMGAGEVVVVWYDPRRIDYARLLRSARETRVVEQVYYANPDQAEAALALFPSERVLATTEFRADSQPQYYLHQTLYGRLPLTAMQAIKINAALAEDRVEDQVDPSIYLSPRQQQLVKLMAQFDDLPWETMTAQPTIEQAWDRAAVMLEDKMASLEM